MSSAVKEKKDDLLEQATNQANEKQEETTPEQTETRSNAKERAVSYKPDSEGRVSTEGLDQSLVSQAKKGSMFGEKDYARYQSLLKGGDGGEASDPGNKSNTPEQGQGDTMQPALEAGTGDNNIGKPPTGGAQTGSSNDYFSNKAEFDYNYSKKAFNVDDYISKNIKQATDTTKADDQYRGLKQGVHDTVNYYRNRSNLTTLGIFGDIWNTNQRPSWKAPGTPEKIETTYDKGKDKD